MAQLGNSKVALAQRVITLRGKKGLLDNAYLCYLLQTSEIQHQLNGRASGTTVTGIKQSELRKLSLHLPPVADQLKIARVLSDIDRKIELNRQQNQTLEAMAQALFKSWFVDFDPVIDKALAAGNPIPEALQAKAQARQALGDKRKPLPEHIQQYFPDRFVYHEEIGWVPEGWNVVTLDKFVAPIRETVKSVDLAGYKNYVGLEHIDRKCLALNKTGSTENVASNKSKYEKHDILFGKLRPYFHKVCVAPDEGVCSTDIVVFRARELESFGYALFTIYSGEFVDHAHQTSTGTRMPRASIKDLISYKCLSPNDELLGSFNEMASSVVQKTIINAAQSLSLGQIRDTLLPKLLSGELKIPDAEKLAKEAL